MVTKLRKSGICPSCGAQMMFDVNIGKRITVMKGTCKGFTITVLIGDIKHE